MAFIFEDLNYGRGTIPPHAVMTKPQAVRWDKGDDLWEGNVVIMSIKEAEKHEKECLRGDSGVEEVWGKDVVDLVKRKSEEARRVVAYRRG